jgi:predicted RNase H-like nuclease (RuvC/YqgF family)
MQAQVEESENEELENQYKIQEEAEQKREMETYKQLSKVEGTLEQLEKQQNSLDSQLQEELNRYKSSKNKFDFANNGFHNHFQITTPAPNRQRIYIILGKKSF